MKRIFLMVMMLLLAACSGGGGGGGTAVDTGPPAGQPTLTGTITIELADETGKKLALASPDPTFVRIVVTNPSYVITGKSFKAMQTVAIGSTDPVQFVLPEHSGYLVEALYYTVEPNGTLKIMQKYGAHGNVNVSSASTAVISLTIAPISVTLKPVLPNLQDFVYAGIPGGAAADTYDMVAIFPLETPLQPAWRYYVQTNKIFTLPQHSGTPSLIHTRIAAPNSFINGNLYYQGEFFIKTSLLDTGEVYTSWTFNYPNPSLEGATNPYITMSLRGPNVDISNNDPNNPSLIADVYPPRNAQLAVPTAVQTSATIPVSIIADDSVGVTAYNIQQTPISDTLAGVPAAAATDVSTGWVAVAPVKNLALLASYQVQGALSSGRDNFVNLYVRVMDAAGNVSVASSLQAVTIRP
jgi:hypothetical protein